MSERLSIEGAGGFNPNLPPFRKIGKTGTTITNTTEGPVTQLGSLCCQLRILYVKVRNVVLNGC